MFSVCSSFSTLLQWWTVDTIHACNWKGKSSLHKMLLVLGTPEITIQEVFA